MLGRKQVVQIQNSLKSPLRGVAGMRDEGQRYVVRYTDGSGDRRIYGFAETEQERDRFMSEIRKNRMWSNPKWSDRKRLAQFEE